MIMYTWLCTSCHHEWEATINSGGICEWCGEDGHLLNSSYKGALPSDLYKSLTGGKTRSI